MDTIFYNITSELSEDLDAIRSLVKTFSEHKQTPKLRIAAANSATLLLAATFEEFVRQMAREYARAVVMGSESLQKLPKQIAATAWKRTMQELGKIKFDPSPTQRGMDKIGAAHSRFSAVYEFCKGDLTREIYLELIHNERNMRPIEINALFNISDMKDVCRQCSDKKPLLEFFGEENKAEVHDRFVHSLNGFMDRRNAVAHALNASQFEGPENIIMDIGLLKGFALALAETLTKHAPKPLERMC